MRNFVAEFLIAASLALPKRYGSAPMSDMVIDIESASTIEEEASELLSMCFGESYTPDLWVWKHVANPFGQSLVAVARKKGRMVGIRPLVRSAIRYGNGWVPAVQCVDSAVDAGCRRKGLFRKLNDLSLSKIDDTLVFNTPNEKSYPAYMKMGWRDVGGFARFFIPLSCRSTLNYLLRRVFSAPPKTNVRDAVEGLKKLEEIDASIPEDIDAVFESHAKSLREKIVLRLDSKWLAWRVAGPGRIPFLYYRKEGLLAIVFYVFRTNGMTGVRILDTFGNFKDWLQIRRGIRDFFRMLRKNRFDFVSFLCGAGNPFASCARTYLPVRKKTVNFVVNTARLKTFDKGPFLAPANWALMLGAFDYN